MAKRSDAGTLDPADSIDEVLAKIRARGGRVTQSRRLILDALHAATGHQTADELATEVQRVAPDTHLSTIYRKLEELEELGAVSHVHLGHGPAVYSLTVEPHCHLVCETCEKIIDVPDDLFRGLTRRTKDQFRFDIDPRHFAVLGLCQDCR